MNFQDPVGAHRIAGIPLTGQTWADETINGDDIAGVIFQDCVFERLTLEGVILEQTMFLNSRFEDCVFRDCQITRTRWIGCEGSGIRISGGELEEAVFSQCRWKELEIDQTGLRMVLSENRFGRFALNGAGSTQQNLTISDCEFESVLAENANWTQGTAVGTALEAWSMDGAHFEQCSFIKATGNGVDFSSVEFQSCNLFQGEFKEARFRMGKGSIFAECDLSEANFSEAQVEGALFVKSNATGANFERAQLNNALFPKATLASARFAGASALRSVWTEADLTEADLSGMDATGGVFRNAIFAGADVQGAVLAETDLHGVEETLQGAVLRDSRGTIESRAEREKEALNPPQSPSSAES